MGKCGFLEIGGRPQIKYLFINELLLSIKFIPSTKSNLTMRSILKHQELNVHYNIFIHPFIINELLLSIKFKKPKAEAKPKAMPKVKPKPNAKANAEVTA